MSAIDDRPKINIIGGSGRLCGHCGKEVPETDTFESHLFVAHDLRKCMFGGCTFIIKAKHEYCVEHRFRRARSA